jgi:hypothetical protein
MEATREDLLDESGMVLMTVLLLIALLIAAGMGAAFSVQNDFLMTSNLRGGMAASYLADAGFEWAKQRVAVVDTMPPVLTDETHSLGPGRYAVTFLSSVQTGPLGAQVMLRSLGKVRNASETVEGRITKSYDLADAALVLRGNARSINFSGPLFSISGLDHDAITAVVIANSRPRAGISVSSAAVLDQVIGALDPVQRQNITGATGAGSSIVASDYMRLEDVARISSDLCASPQAVVVAISLLGEVSVVDQSWGNGSEPQLRCFNGQPGSGDSVVVGGSSSGAGILVVRDAELVISGNFHWDGLIVVSGADVGFRVVDAGTKEIMGALVVHESGNGTGSGPALIDLQGSVRLRYSRPALSQVASLVPASTLAASYAFLSYTLHQDYRRSLHP